MEITSIDRNFKPAVVDGLEVKYHDVTETPIVLEGLPWYEKGKNFYRLPYTMTVNDVNQGALDLSHHTTGVCARFCTDSPYITLRAMLAHSCDMNHMPRTGSAGFDIYAQKNGKLCFVGTAQPDPRQILLERVIYRNSANGFKEYCLNFPLYGGADQVEIGIAPGSSLTAPHAHAIKDPILFYGSSITQGGCASRPGNNYCSWLCRAVDAEQINLGFSGSGRGEIAVAKAIASLKLSCFVYDYDHNAPDAAYLEATHEPFFKLVRETNPFLPVIMMSKCNFKPDSEDPARREIIRTTYNHAIAAGDENVWFIDGETLFGSEDWDGSTVDTCHPNDLGFYRMYQAVLPVLKLALKRN